MHLCSSHLLQCGLYFLSVCWYFNCQQSGQRSAICMWERTFSTSESWSLIWHWIQSCFCICLKLDSLLNALSLDLPSIYAGAKSRYRSSCHRYPILALSLNHYVQFSWDKQDKNHNAMQETGGLILCLYIVMSARALSHDPRWHHSRTWSISPFLSLLVTSPVAEQVTAECSATFLGRPRCHAVTAGAFLRAEHVTLHLLASLSVILPGMLTSMMQLLMTHIWLLHKCWFNMNEIWAEILWEVWKLRASTT